MDAHGAWIASAVDLARFVTAFDDPGRSKSLRPASFASIFEHPEGLAGHERDGSPRARYYGLGWSIEERDGGRSYAAHSGSLPGTSTRIVRGPDGRDIVILLNARVGPLGGRLDTILEAALEAAFLEVRQWPDVDLFAASP